MSLSHKDLYLGCRTSRAGGRGVHSICIGLFNLFFFLNHVLKWNSNRVLWTYVIHFNVNLSVFYLSAVEELFLSFVFAFCCTCERILQEPRDGIYEGKYIFKKQGVKSLHATSLACVVLLDFLMLFILFGVKIKESFSIIWHLCDPCVGRRLVEN